MILSASGKAYTERMDNERLSEQALKIESRMEEGL